MRIFHIAAEYAPLIKAGGLGDAVQGLVKVTALSHPVTVILPFYSRLLDLDQTKLLSTITFPYTFLGPQVATAYSYTHDNVTLTVIQLESQPDLFNNSTIYTNNDTMRFCAFSCAAAAYVYNAKADVVHLHDWHVGLVAGLLKQAPASPRIVFTIHNFSYRGYTSTQLLGASGIDDFWLSQYRLFRDDQTSVLMKGALYCSDVVTTVSPNYAQEILNDYSDYELHDALVAKRSVFSGILNGIDEKRWDPATDPSLVAHYNAELLNTPDILFTKKEANKVALFTKLGLSLDYFPLMCVISRLVEQKGLFYIKQAILHAMEHAYAFVIIGTCYDEQTQQEFLHLQESLTSSPNIRIILDYNDSLSRLTYAASDMICIPSLFEPCGLSQLIAMRYGTIPLARATGGLVDTVLPGVNGWLFTEGLENFRAMLSEALHTYNYEPEQWLCLMNGAMHFPSTIARSAEHYFSLY